MNKQEAIRSAPAMFAPYRPIEAEGRRIGLTTCNICGATITVGEDEYAPTIHRRWHNVRGEGMDLA